MLCFLLFGSRLRDWIHYMTGNLLRKLIYSQRHIAISATSTLRAAPLDLRDLKTFLHLAESRHFGRSARAMHVSPSTLSRQIQRLEDDLGQPLFVRDNRTVTLTEARRRTARFRPANAVAVSTAAPHHRSARTVALWRITYLLLGDRCLQPSAADSRSLPRGTPVGGD